MLRKNETIDKTRFVQIAGVTSPNLCSLLCADQKNRYGQTVKNSKESRNLDLEFTP